MNVPRHLRSGRGSGPEANGGLSARRNRRAGGAVRGQPPRLLDAHRRRRRLRGARVAVRGGLRHRLRELRRAHGRAGGVDRSRGGDERDLAPAVVRHGPQECGASRPRGPRTTSRSATIRFSAAWPSSRRISSARLAAATTMSTSSRTPQTARSGLACTSDRAGSAIERPRGHSSRRARPRTTCTRLRP